MFSELTFSFSPLQATDFTISGTTNGQVHSPFWINLNPVNDLGEPTDIIKPDKYIGLRLIHRDTAEPLDAWYTLFNIG